MNYYDGYNLTKLYVQRDEVYGGVPYTVYHTRAHLRGQIRPSRNGRSCNPEIRSRKLKQALWKSHMGSVTLPET